MERDLPRVDELLTELEELRRLPGAELEPLLEEASLAALRASSAMAEMLSTGPLSRARTSRRAEQAVGEARKAIAAARERLQRPQPVGPRLVVLASEAEDRAGESVAAAADLGCPGCQRPLRLHYRAESRTPVVEGEVSCPWPDCGQPVSCAYPWSTFALWVETGLERGRTG